MPARRIYLYVSYLPGPTEAFVARLRTQLSARWRERLVFLDLEALDGLPGREDESHDVRVCFVVIGPDWHRSGDLHSLADPMRIELAAASKHRLELIPMLVGGAPLPASELLPDVLRPLRHRSALALPPTLQFEEQMERVNGVLEFLWNETRPPVPRWRARLLQYITLASFGALCALPMLCGDESPSRPAALHPPLKPKLGQVPDRLAADERHTAPFSAQPYAGLAPQHRAGSDVDMFGSGFGHTVDRFDLGPEETSTCFDRLKVWRSLKPDVVRRVVRSNLEAVGFCYDAGKAIYPSLGRHLVLRFQLAPTGQVRAVIVKRSTLDSERAAHCIAQSVVHWSFPPSAAGDIVTIELPLFFAPRGRTSLHERDRATVIVP